MLKPIPIKMREEIALNPWMKECCLCHRKDIKIDWHHNFIYAGTRVNEIWAILPVCVECHRKADTTKVKEKLDWIMMRQMTSKDFSKYNKKDWRQRKLYLENLFGQVIHT